MPEIRFTSFPRTLPPPPFISGVVSLFRSKYAKIATGSLQKGLTSDGVLLVLRDQLLGLGFEVEASKRTTDKIKRPVYFGEDGKPDLQYEVDAYHPGWHCGLEVEAGRAWMGNAVYRDLIQALVMVNLDHLILAVPNSYKYMSNDKPCVSHDYDNTVAVANAIYGHTRIVMPFALTVLGY
jgi:hypothetical protein